MSREQKLVCHEFDCPVCDANNPRDNIRVGQELMCYYCGITVLVKEKHNKLVFKEL